MARIDDILQSLGGLLGMGGEDKQNQAMSLGQGLIGGQGPYEELDSFNFSQPVNVQPVDPLMQDFKKSQDFSMTDPDATAGEVITGHPSLVDPDVEIAPDRRTDKDKLSILDAATRAKVLAGDLTLADAIAPPGEFLKGPDGQMQTLLKKSKDLKGKDKEGFLKKLFNNRESMIQLALAFNTMRLEPDAGLAKALGTELASIRKNSAKSNRTYEILKKTHPKLYAMVQSGEVSLKEAINIAKLEKRDINVGSIPKDYQLIQKDGKSYMEVIPGSKTARELEAQEGQQVRKIGSQQDKTNLIGSEVDKAIEMLSSEEWASGVKGAFVREHGGFLAASSPAIIKANIGFDRLQVMREESPTGGALGQVAVQELVALQATLGSLDLRQSPELVIATLKNVKATYDKNMAIVLQQYGAEEMRKYGVPVPGEQNNNDPLGIR